MEISDVSSEHLCTLRNLIHPPHFIIYHEKWKIGGKCPRNSGKTPRKSHILHNFSIQNHLLFFISWRICPIFHQFHQFFHQFFLEFSRFSFDFPSNISFIIPNTHLFEQCDFMTVYKRKIIIIWCLICEYPWNNINN